MGKSSDAIELVEKANVDAIAIASVLHYKLESVPEIKATLIKNQVKVRV